MTCSKADKDSVSLAAECLKGGGIAILPTDTVYGISGIADLPGRERMLRTAERIYAMKGRPESKPLIRLIAEPDDIFLYTDDNIPPEVLCRWPGAVTLIVGVRPEFSALWKSDTIAFRCPGDSWLRAVIKECGAPVYSTSVNRSGKDALGTEHEIIAEFGDEADLFVTDGDKTRAVPSTLVRVEDGAVRVLRQGPVRF